MFIDAILDIEDPNETNEKGEKIIWIIVEVYGARKKLSMTEEVFEDLKKKINE